MRRVGEIVVLANLDPVGDPAVRFGISRFLHQQVIIVGYQPEGNFWICEPRSCEGLLFLADESMLSAIQ